MSMKKSILTNAALALASVLATLFVLELVIEKVLLPSIPVKFHFALPSGLEVLAQSSKKQRLPVDYVALAGDSYAQGKGDWLMDVDPQRNDPFHSAHVLHQLSGFDVVSFGRSGASNTRSWVREPVSKYRYLHDLVDSDLQPPAYILAYFYAGNDLSDNYLEMRDRFIPEYGGGALADDAAWQHYFDKEIRDNNVGPHGSAHVNRGWLIISLFKIIKNELTGKQVDPDAVAEQAARSGGTERNGKDSNQVLINGGRTTIPGGLQAPAMGLTREQTEIALLAMKKSLIRLKQDFPTSRIIVVYVPSVMEVYTPAANQISVLSSMPEQGSYGHEERMATELAERSAEISARVAAEAQSQGLAFIDTSKDLRAAATRNLLHGPKDWLHFNRLGYETFSASIACGMAAQKLWPESTCPNLAATPR